MDRLSRIRWLAPVLAGVIAGQGIHGLVRVTSALGAALAWSHVLAQPQAAQQGREAAVQALHGFQLSTDPNRLRWTGPGGVVQDEAVDQFFQGGTPADRTAIENAFGDNVATEAVRSQIFANMGSGTAQGAAYETVRDAATGRSHPDLRNDPVWNGSRQILDGNDPVFATFFNDCTEQPIPSSGPGENVHVPDYRTCERIEVPEESSCTLRHQIANTQYLAHAYLGAYGVSENNFEFDLKNGTWHSVAPSDGTQFTGSVSALNFTEICGNNFSYQFDGAFDWPTAPVDGEFDSSVCYQVTQHPSCNNGLVGRVRILDNCSSGEDWHKYATELRFRYAQITSDVWTPAACLTVATAVDDGACRGHAQCTEGPDENGCATINGLLYCDAPQETEECAEFADPEEGVVGGIQDMPDPDSEPECIEYVMDNDPYRRYLGLADGPVGLDKLCTEATVTASDCGFNEGDMACWTDPSGVEHCPYNPGDQHDTCAVLANDPTCGFVESRCIDGARGHSGFCYATTDRYDCGYTVTTPPPAAGTRMVCDGAIRCMGEDCVTLPRETNRDFGRAATALQTAQFSTMDISCGDPAMDGGAHEGAETGCRIFSGEARTCKKALGGWVNCCEKPSGVSIVDYLKLAYSGAKVIDRTNLLGHLAQQGLDIPGAWKTVSEPAIQTWESLTQPVTSAWDQMVAEVGFESAQAANLQSLSVEAIEQQLVNATGDFIGQVFGEEVKNALFSTATDGSLAFGGGTATVGTAIMTAINVIMIAYLIYTIINILVHIIWECEQEEFELGAKRVLRSCAYAGSYCASDTLFGCVEKRESYCCYASPLSRIVQEQLHPDGFGSSRNPNCGGLTMEEMSSLDWDRLDLSEWAGLLTQAGVVPASQGAADVQYGESVTRQPNGEDALARTMGRLNGADMDGAAGNVRQQLWQQQGSRP